MAVYMQYQYLVHVQGYDVIEVDMYIKVGVKVTRQQDR
jgi:hypothetical protein